MKIGMAIISVGVVMFIIGLVLYYSIELGQKDHLLRYIKNMGTFIGFSGMGVTLAGILIHLINRNEAAIKENLDV